MMLVSVQPVTSLSPSPVSSTGVVFAWVFGYDGNIFLPLKELGLTQGNIVSLVASMSSSVGGKDHLYVVTAVSETPGRVVGPAMFSEVSGYVSLLKQDAKIVFGRLSVGTFNDTSSTTIYSEVSKYVNQLSLNGIWLDHAVDFYAAAGQSRFNTMMQRLVGLYPSLVFILDHAETTAIITPLAGTTWANRVIVTPSLALGTYNEIDASLMASLSSLYGGRVILHFEAFSAIPSIPMNVFAEQSIATQISAVRNLAYNGLHPSQPSLAYNFLFPILGAATCACSRDPGVLYNSQTYGYAAKGTFQSFLPSMLAEAQG